MISEPLQSARILIVEDDPAIASVIARSLGDAGLLSDHAETGLDGLWLAREGSYGAICLDILLPEMNGYEVCRTLRSENVHTPILMLTAKTGEYDETDGFDLGADDYLRKPFTPSVLVARIRALLRRSHIPQTPNVIERGGISFDGHTNTCTVDAAPVALTTREAVLLGALLRTGDGPLSRDALLREVWGFDFDGNTNIVDVYIGYLRKKLGRDRIENVRGRGYRIADQ